MDEYFLVVRKEDGLVVNLTVGLPYVRSEKYDACQRLDETIEIGSKVSIIDGVALLVEPATGNPVFDKNNTIKPEALV